MHVGLDTCRAPLKSAKSKGAVALLDGQPPLALVCGHLVLLKKKLYIEWVPCFGCLGGGWTLDGPPTAEQLEQDGQRLMRYSLLLGNTKRRRKKQPRAALAAAGNRLSEEEMEKEGSCSTLLSFLLHYYDSYSIE